MKRLLGSIIFLVLAGAAAYAQASWAGNYVFIEGGGKDSGCTPFLTTHKMEISGQDGDLTVTILTNGYRDLVGTAKIEGGRLNIYFERYGENNYYKPYERGDLLLSLGKKTVKGKMRTFWSKFTPLYPENEKTGKVYFKKT
jgi:hypothetical protein